MLSHRVRVCVRALAPVLFGTAAAAVVVAAPPLDPPRQYEVRGDGDVTVSGSGCCGDTRFSGRFQAAYQVDSLGQVILASLRVSLDDVEVDVHGGFLDLFTETIRLRCAALASKRAAVGWVSGSTVNFPIGSVALNGFSAEERLPSGECAPPTLQLAEASNTAPVSLLHDPLANKVELNATFSGTLEGEPYVITFRSKGRFDNRPPVAQMQFETPAAPQGMNCPAIYQPNQGWVAEANSPSGLVATLRSSSTDVDGPAGASNRADLLSERWLHSRSSGPRSLLGVGYRTGPLTFEWGPTHRVELVAMDLAGAASAAQCSFRVVDSSPPVVTPPPPRTIGCSRPGGASPGTSSALSAFLAGAIAVDAVDPTLVQLPRQVGGVDVTSTTLFPADGVARPVSFRFRDDGGLVGTATSNLTVVDEPPNVTVTLSPKILPADHAWHTVNATVTATDACGGLITLKLYKINSNAPANDATDIAGAAIGTDDRSFSLFGRLAPLGQTRIYRVTYKGIDAAGNSRLADATVTVKAF